MADLHFSGKQLLKFSFFWKTSVEIFIFLVNIFWIFDLKTFETQQYGRCIKLHSMKIACFLIIINAKRGLQNNKPKLVSLHQIKSFLKEMHQIVFVNGLILSALQSVAVKQLTGSNDSGPPFSPFFFQFPCYPPSQPFLTERLLW